jgi:hypothetical protein
VKTFKMMIMILLIVVSNMFSQELSKDFYIDAIGDDFIGVYLPIEYIVILEENKNHSLAIHHNDDNLYHDVLIVSENNIRSNLKWHDGYAIKSNEGNLYKFNRIGSDRMIIDNNGYLYKKIGDDPSQAYSTTQFFVTNIVFESLLGQNIGVTISENGIVIPFLYFFTGEDNFTVELDDIHWEEGSSILLKSRSRGNRQFYFTLFMITDGIEYIFYEEKEGRRGPFSSKAEAPFFQFKINQDKEILLALSGLNDNLNNELFFCLDALTNYEKRKVINAMFALNGYQFATEEWQNYFNSYSWYKPNKSIRNDRSILNIRQQKLLDYLSK